MIELIKSLDWYWWILAGYVLSYPMCAIMARSEKKRCMDYSVYFVIFCIPVFNFVIGGLIFMLFILGHLSENIEEIADRVFFLGR